VFWGLTEAFEVRRSTPLVGKRPADLAFLGRFAREMVCPLTGKLRGRHDDGYGSSRS